MSQTLANPPQPAATAGRTRVLLVSLFHPELMRGGAQQVCYELFEGLREHPDLDVTLLASTDNSYPALFKSGARITGFDGRPGEFLFLMQDYDYWWHRTQAPQMVDAFAEFLSMVRPDVVHFHHFFTYGADLITLTRRILPHARIIFTFHEFISICAADGQMVRRTDRSLCTQAGQVRCHQCFPERRPEDFLVRRMWFLSHLRHVDQFTTPTKFMIEPYVKWGIPREKIVQVTNGQRNYAPANLPPPPPAPHNRFGFFGQMVENKGVHIILRAVRHLRAEGFDNFIVELNGDNLRYAREEVRLEIEAFLAAEAELPPEERRVINNGGYHVDDLAGRMARIDWCMVPSTWWEIFGLVISEAWMFGKPIICSNVGGPAERITDQVDGLHVPVGDHRALARVMHRAATEPGLWAKLHANLPEPPARDTMVEGFRVAYGLTRVPA